MTKKFSSFKGHQLITESWRKFIDGSETSAQGSEMELEEGLFSRSMAVQGEIDKHALNLYRVLEALRPVDRKEIIDDIINELQKMANEDSISQNDDDSYPQMELEEARKAPLSRDVGPRRTQDSAVRTAEEIAGEVFDKLDRIDDPRERKQIISVLIVNLQMEYDNILT